MSRRPTMADVARAAGVHKATASRALSPHSSGQLNPETVRRVLAAAKQLGYTPNAAARSLRTSRSRTVGVLIPDLTNPLFPHLVRGMEDVLLPRGYTALLANTDNDEAHERTQFQALTGRQVDGFIVATARRDHPLLREAHEAGIAVVLINRTTDQPLFPCVCGDDATGIGLAVDHLVGLGHTAIAHVSGPRTLSPGVVRAQAFHSALAAHGIDPGSCPVIDAPSYSEAAGATAADELLERSPAITAIVAGNDLIALGTLHTLRRRGLRCPQDVSIIGFNDMRFVDEFQPPLTTVHVPHHELGAEAARLLLDQLEGEDRGTGVPKRVLLPVDLVVRASTAPPPHRP
ncbi:LacI family DNA-binding transcriptional regulator [Streptomyces sp. NPDC001222]|uniref:LacI family DNA-binding transcriptional regulator n=1 Tax=Streptomyces sp. NPDC001222 TaxID=3364548 RepID=UPI0036768822